MSRLADGYLPYYDLGFHQIGVFAVITMLDPAREAELEGYLRDFCHTAFRGRKG